MTYPTPTRADHQTFCENESWEPVRDAHGRTGTRHITYKITLPDGRVLRTRVSHPPDRSTYGPSMWSHILRDQLQVSEAEFWACIRAKSTPDRGGAQKSGTGLPARLVFQLVHEFHVPEDEVARLTREEALALLTERWSQPGTEQRRQRHPPEARESP